MLVFVGRLDPSWRLLVPCSSSGHLQDRIKTSARHFVGNVSGWCSGQAGVTQEVLRGSVRALRCLSLFSALALRVRLDDASVWGVLDTDWLWLFLAALSLWLWLLRELPETALTLDCGRLCELADEAVGGGMGEGKSWLLWVLEKDGCVWVLPWAASGLRKGWVLGWLPLSLFLRSATDLLVMAGWCAPVRACESL
jgi:hypothetical protein